MTLDPGLRLGPYEVVSPLGAGGMGEVYRAKDTRLDRTVALKVLPSHLAQDPERRQRFEREARAISALNHPHICVLHDVGHQGGIDFLVMEYLEGESLADRLKKGPLPIEQVLRYAVEIAEALDRAHRQGIVHRDLKPGNVMVTRSGTKLLDFGLAKLRAAGTAPTAASELSALPTGNKPLTAEGSLLGTFQYMAPEQLEGGEPDARTDIFALGAVVYEMATGQRAFTGTSQASLIAAILKGEPAPISRLQPLTPPALDRVVATCLAKDPDDRWQNAHDLAAELRWIAGAGSQAGLPAPVAARRRRGERLAWIAAVIAAGALGMTLDRALVRRGEKPANPRQVRFQIPRAARPRLGIAVSPDRVAYQASVGNTAHLYVRPLSSSDATLLPGTEAGFLPFWSPDGGQLGFAVEGKLKTVRLSGGPAQTVCGHRGVFLGGTWNRDGTIVFSDGAELFRVPAIGGEPKALGRRASGEAGRYWPWFLPDGRRFLYLSTAERRDEQGIFVASLDSEDRRRIVATDHNAAYSPSGHLLFMRGGVLVAQAFDAKTLELSGETFPLSDDVAAPGGVGGGFPGAAFSVSETGVLAWETSRVDTSELTWFDRSGRKLGTLGEPAQYSNPALSPDERSLAVGRVDPQKTTRDLWIFDLRRGNSRRLTFDPADELNPVWSPDGSRIAFTSDRKGTRDIYQKPADGAGDDDVLLESKDWLKNVEDWSGDGRYLLYNSYLSVRTNLFLLPLSIGIDRNPIPLTASNAAEQRGQFAPNSRWIAYDSAETGRSEVYVQGVSPGALRGRGKWQLSTAGGTEPRWRRDGKELFYMSGSTLMAVGVETDGTSFEAATPRPLFEIRLSPVVRRNRYVVTEDGQRFLALAPAEQADAPINVLLNWLPSHR